METSKKNFEIFNASLKKYATNSVAKMFAKFDKFYFKNKSSEPLKRRFGSGINSYELPIEPWLFSEIVFYSTKYNDYRQEITEEQAWSLYGLYFNYNIESENEYARKNYSDPNINNLPPILYGYLQEQGLYEISENFFINRCNRNYHLLNNVKIDETSLNDIVFDSFGIDLKTYVQYLSIIVIASIGYVDLSCDEILQTVDNDIYFDILNDISIDYEDCRNTKNSIVNKDIFKIKPVLITQNGEYIAPSTHLLFYYFSDKLYWLVKDAYKKTNTFVTKFGEIFENYAYQILIKQYGEQNVLRMPLVENEKSVDFKIETDNYVILIEVKAGEARFNAKKTELNKDDFDFFIKNNIKDAMEQLDHSAKHITTQKQIIPIILNYDQIYVEDGLLFKIDTLYPPHNYPIENLLLTGIDYFENFIFTYNTIEKLDAFFKENQDNLKTHIIVEKSTVNKNYFYQDIFDEFTKQFLSVLKAKSN